jgi:hypothetical protein
MAHDDTNQSHRSIRNETIPQLNDVGRDSRCMFAYDYRSHEPMFNLNSLSLVAMQLVSAQEYDTKTPNLL